MAVTLPPPYSNAPIRPADVTQTMIDLYNVVAQINAGLSPIPPSLSGPGGAALIGSTPAGGITSTNVQAALNELDTKKTTATVLAAAGGAALVGNTPAGGISSTTVQTALNELDTKKASTANVQSGANTEAIGTGTADAILGAYTPAITSLTNGLELRVRSPGANTVIAPTFQADGTASKIIVKGNGSALQASDAQGWLTLRYDSTLDRWVLLNPATPAGTALIVSSENGGQLAGLRNRLINGDIRIDQRNSGGAVTPTGSTYTVDRFFSVLTQSSKITYQQVADAPPGFKFSLKATVASQFSPGAGDVFSIKQLIEGQNIVDFQIGTATAQTITATLWVKGSVAGTYSCHFLNGGTNRSYIGTITVAAGWAKQTVTLTLDTAGTWLTDSGIGLQFGIDLGSGANFANTAGSWLAGAFTRTSGSVTFVNQVNGSTLNITGIQLEIGSVSTPFEQRFIGLETSLCQRYYQLLNGGMAGVTGAGTANSVNIPFAVPMRASPNVVSTPITNTNVTASAMGVINNYMAQMTSTGVASGGYIAAANGKFDAEL